MLRAMKSVNMKIDEPPSFFMIVGMLLYSFIINYWLKWRFRDKESLGIMARMKKSDKRWMWVAKPGDKIVVSRTAAIPSKQISRREFRALEEILNIYGRMLWRCASPRI
jgi:hypothetical protein